MATTKQTVPEGAWPCACVKRDRRSGQITHIKMHDKGQSRCRVCKTTRADAERFAQEAKK